jgi:hypothetical protein
MRNRVPLLRIFADAMGSHSLLGMKTVGARDNLIFRQSNGKLWAWDSAWELASENMPRVPLNSAVVGSRCLPP